MTETMVERVAHAMAQRSDARVAGMFTINALPMRGTENFLELAKAALEAMRVPTEAMNSAGGFVIDLEGFGPTIASTVYESMIDAAVKE